MGNFENKRSDAIRRKNEAYSKAERFDRESEIFTTRRKEIVESKSRIPDDLPEEVKAQIDAMYEQKESELADEADEMADRIKEAMDDAVEAVRDMQSIGDELGKKASNLSSMKEVPLVGAFLEHKGQQLDDQKDQMYDLAKEAQQYSDKLAESRNRVLRRP